MQRTIYSETGKEQVKINAEEEVVDLLVAKIWSTVSAAGSINWHRPTSRYNMQKSFMIKQVVQHNHSLTANIFSTLLTFDRSRKVSGKDSLPYLTSSHLWRTISFTRYFICILLPSETAKLCSLPIIKIC